MPLASAPRLRQWVEDGGILLVGPRAACKDANNNVIADLLPGPLRELTGTTVVEYGKQNRPELRPLLLRIAGKELQSALWYEELEPAEGTEVIGTWTSRHLHGKAAVTRRSVGKGSVIHVGTWLDDALLTALCELLPLPQPHDAPEGIEIVDRVHPNGKTLRFVINHRDEPVTLPLPKPVTNLLDGRQHNTHLSLPANGVAVF